MDRRTFLSASAGIAASSFLPGVAEARGKGKEARFKLCLGQYSLHRRLGAKQEPRLDPLDYPAFARKTFGFRAVDYWSGPFQDKVGDPGYLGTMAARARDAGVEAVLLLVDGAGRIGDPDKAARETSVERHARWLEAARILGCSSIRVNAHSEGSPEEQTRLCADGISKLCGRAEALGLDVLVENHGGLSSNGAWVAGLMKAVGHPRCGTLPDFGNFHEYDRYQGVADMLPWARLVCAKSRDFDEAGNETTTDYARMMGIVAESGFRGFIEVEYEGGRLGEEQGIRATQRLLERVLRKL